MASQLLGIKTRFTNDLGSPLVGGQVYTYFAGTSTNQDSYSDAALTVPNTNPVILDDTGSADIFLKGSYRIRVFDKSGLFVEEQDNVTQAASQGATTELSNKVNAVEVDLSKVKQDTGITATAKLGGVTRSQSDKNTDIISVKDFLTPDDAYVKAVDEGFRVYVPDGDYTLNVSNPDMSIFYGVGTINGQKISDNGALSSEELAQKMVNELGLGFDASEVFAGAGRSIQGIAYLNDGGVEKLFVTSQVAGDSYAFNERVRITEFHLTNDGAVATPIAFSPELSLGHTQDLAVEKTPDGIYLWTTNPTTVEGEGAKGVSRVKWSGATTSQIDTYMLCGATGTSENRSNIEKGTPCISNDGKYIVFIGIDSTTSTKGANKVFLFDKSEVVNAANPITLEPVQVFELQYLQVDDGDIIQGVASDGRFIYTLVGYTNFKQIHYLQKYTLSGELIRSVPITTVKEEYGLPTLKGGSNIGTPHVIEPEGLTLRGNELLVGIIESWKSAGDIVSFKGENYVYIGTGVNVSPYNIRFWSLTNLAANKGAYSSSATYSVSSAIVTLKRKTVWSIKEPTDDTQELPINSQLFSESSNSTLPVINKSQAVTGKYGSSITVGTYSENKTGGKLFKSYSALNNTFNVYDPRVDAPNTASATIIFNELSTKPATTLQGKGDLYLRANTELTDGAGINMYGSTDNNAGQLRLYAMDGENLKTLVLRGTVPALYPTSNNEISLGIGAFNFSNIYTNKVTVAGSEGISGSFTTANGETVTVTGGIITAIV